MHYADALWYARQADVATNPTDKLAFQAKRYASAEAALTLLETLRNSGQMPKEEVSYLSSILYTFFDELLTAQMATQTDPVARKRALQLIESKEKAHDRYVRERIKDGIFPSQYGCTSSIRVLKLG